MLVQEVLREHVNLWLLRADLPRRRRSLGSGRRVKGREPRSSAPSAWSRARRETPSLTWAFAWSGW